MRDINRNISITESAKVYILIEQKARWGLLPMLIVAHGWWKLVQHAKGENGKICPLIMRMLESSIRDSLAICFITPGCWPKFLNGLVGSLKLILPPTPFNKG